jgi:hypothetical protein
MFAIAFTFMFAFTLGIAFRFALTFAFAFTFMFAIAFALPFAFAFPLEFTFRSLFAFEIVFNSVCRYENWGWFWIGFFCRVSGPRDELDESHALLCSGCIVGGNSIKGF